MGRESSHGTKELFNLPLLALKARHLCDSAFCTGKSRMIVSMQVLLSIPKKFKNVYEDIVLLNFHENSKSY